MQTPPCFASLSRGSLTRSSTASTVSTTSTLADDIPTDVIKSSYYSTLEREPSTLTITAEICGTCQTPLSPLPLTTLQSPLPTQGQNIPLKSTTLPAITQIATSLLTLPTPPRIIGLLLSERSGSRLYAESTAKKCIGKFEYELLDVVDECEGLDERDKFELVRSRIEGFNGDEKVTGLIVYFPIFGDASDDTIRGLVDPRIDLEGINPASLAQSYLTAPTLLGEECTEGIIYPCTPLAVVRILQSTPGLYDLAENRGNRLAGKTVTVVNRSETVGRPLAAMLANDGATVFSIDIADTQILQRHSPSTPYCTRSADLPTEYLYSVSDIIISAVPSDTFQIPTKSIKPGATCINVAGQNNFEDDVKTRAAWFALRVGGVTTLMLQVNALILHTRQSRKSAE